MEFYSLKTPTDPYVCVLVLPISGMASAPPVGDRPVGGLGADRGCKDRDARGPAGQNPVVFVGVFVAPVCPLCSVAVLG